MENNIIWIKEDKTDNIYCCEIVAVHAGETDLVYDVDCIIGSFTQIRIPRSCNLYNSCKCEIIRPYRIKHKGYFMIFDLNNSKGTACFDIEKLK